MVDFNYSTPYGVYPSTNQTAKDFLNALSRDIPNYVVAQNIGKLSPFVRWLLSEATTKPISFPFVSQPVTGATDDSTQLVTNDMSFVVPTSENTNLTEMATFYSNLALTHLFVTDFEAKAFESGNPNVLFDAIKVRASIRFLGFMNSICSWLTGTRVSGSENTNQFYGIKDVIDNGSTNPNFGNISRSTNAWWNSYSWNAQSLWTDNPVAYVYVMRALSKYQHSASTMGMPTAGFCGYHVWQQLVESFTAIERYVIGDPANIGDRREYAVTGIMIQGVPIFPDPYFNNDNAIYFVNFNHVYFKFMSGYDVVTTDWKDLSLVGKLAYFSLMLFGGQLISDAPISCFALTNMPVVSNIV